MHTVRIVTENHFPVKYLKVSARPRYWEDAEVNGVEDTDGDLIPFKNIDRWGPTIDLDEGKIVKWPKGTTASIHYKVCDDGSYNLVDENHNTVLYMMNEYVPSIIGDGDYIIMDIDENGYIANWEVTFDEFEEYAQR